MTRGAIERLFDDIGLERLANRHANRAWLVGRKSEPCATTPFPVEGEQRLLIGQVVDVDDGRESAVEVHPRTEVDHVVFRQLEIERRRRSRRGAQERQSGHESARVAFLVRGLREAAAHVLRRGADIGIASGQVEVVGEAGGELKLWYGGQAVAIANAAEYGPGAVPDSRIEDGIHRRAG